MRSLHQLPTLLLQNVQSAWHLYFVFEKCGVSAESTWTPPLCSVLEFRFCSLKMQSSNELLTVFSKNAEFDSTSDLFLQNAEFASTPHSAFKKCAVHLTSPLCFWKMRSSHQFRLCGVKMRSSNELLTVFSKNVEFVDSTSHMFLQNVESASTPHSAVKKCAVCLTSPLCFWKMRSSHEFRLCGVRLNSDSVH